MQIATYVRRSLVYYRGIHLAVIAGVATAVAVLTGSLIVGDSVRGSLRELVLGRLGATRTVVATTGEFREKLADSFGDSTPIIVLSGSVTQDSGGRRSNGVAVYGVDDRFWKFHGKSAPADAGSTIQISEALAHALNTKAGDVLLVRVEQHSDIPREFLQGRREDSGRTMRLKVGAILAADQLGEFSLRPQQGPVRALFAPLSRLQRDLKLSGKVNTILLKDESYAHAAETLRRVATLDDLGLRARSIVKPGFVSIEKQSTLIDDRIAASVAELKVPTQSFFTYLVNTIRVNGREIPYSLVTAEDNAPSDGLTLNDWAAQDLGITKTGATATLEYFVWRDGKGLVVEHADIPVTAIVPIDKGDRDMAPEFPGISDSPHLADWDPPFPIDLKRVRPKDEQYWDRYRSTPKAFLPLKKGQELWGSRFGNLTSIRVPAAPDLDARLRAAVDPSRAGVSVYPVRAQGLDASQGSTDFGEYFVYFSFFLVVAALMLAGLFFKLGVEQRSSEIGILRTLGFTPRDIRKVFLRQGIILASAGSIMGLFGAELYAWMVMVGLRTYWIGAVGTTLLKLHRSPASLSTGLTCGIAVSIAVIAWTLRGLGKQTPRALIAGSRARGRGSLLIAAAFALAGAAMLGASVAGKMDQSGGFFGSAAMFLIAMLIAQYNWLARGTSGMRSPVTLGFRNASFHPGRGILCIALIASATFIIVAMDAFRVGAPAAQPYPLIAESELPIFERKDLPARTVAFRLRPGDDTSCLNLYEPRNPRILGAPEDFLRQPPYDLLNAALAPGSPIPAIADENSMTYVLHKKVGDEIVLPGDVHLKLVGAVHDSLFQSELLISEKSFLRAFPDQQGYRVFLIDAPVIDAATLDEQFSEYGFDATSTEERLAGFHRVENTYLSTFQALGGLGLILGTLGLSVVLLRNVLEQRRQIALLCAIGYRRRDLSLMVVAENAVLLAGGLVTGTLTALLAILPVLLSRGGHVSILSWSLLLPAVLVTGLAASLVAVAAVVRLPVLETLRAE